MTSAPEPSERELADLAALADGSLPSGRRDKLEARLASSPELRARLEEQQRAVRIVRSAAAAAPQSLRESVSRQRQPRPQARRRRLRLATGLAAALSALALLVVTGVLGGAPGGPTVAQAASLTGRGPVGASPVHSDDSRLISASVDGVRFPYWSDAFGWKASGVRTDQLEHRQATTVFYDNGGRRIGYTIVSGKALAVPNGVRADVRRGTRFRSFAQSGRLIVTWRRAGHTCVLTGDRVSIDALLTLAAWQ